LNIQQSILNEGCKRPGVLWLPKFPNPVRQRSADPPTADEVLRAGLLIPHQITSILWLCLIAMGYLHPYITDFGFTEMYKN
jgi:hypothetical protein